MQSVGCGQNAHYAATRSFAEGHPYVDRYAQETCDLVRRGGHFYAAKGPALDFWSAPWYLLLRTAHLVPKNRNPGTQFPAAMTGVPLRAIWQIGLWAVVLPGALLLWLVRRLADDVEPGTGIATAGILGLGTPVFPLPTLLFPHLSPPLPRLPPFPPPFPRRPGPRPRRAPRLRRVRAALRAAQRRPRGRVCRARRRDRPAAPRRRRGTPALRLASRTRVRARRGARCGAALGVRDLGVRQPVPDRVRRCGDRSRCGRRRAGPRAQPLLHVDVAASAHRCADAAEPTGAPRTLAGAGGGGRRNRASVAARAACGGGARRRPRPRRNRVERLPPELRARARRLGPRAAVPHPAAALPRVRNRTSTAPRTCDRRGTRGHLHRRNDDRDECGAAPLERRHAPLDRTHRRRQLRRDRALAQRHRPWMAGDSSVLCPRRGRG